MGCDRFLDAISARSDDEPSLLDDASLDAHLATCASCRDFAEAVGATRASHRRAGFTVVDGDRIAETARRAATAATRADRASVPSWSRWLLLLVAFQITALDGFSLFGTGTGAGVHDTRHLGAFSVAYAVGLVVVASRPARAQTMLPVAAFLVVAQALSATVDVAQGTIDPASEISHLPQVVSLGLLWYLTRLHRR